MSVKPRVTLALAALLAASSAFAFNLGDAAKAVSGATGNDTSRVASTPQTSGLLDALTGQLGVSDEQALGGTGALLGLAKNKLSTADYSQLAKTVPGLDKLTGSNALGGLGGQLGNLGGGAASGLLGNVSSMGDVNQAFGALGMDQGMTGKFSSVLLDYLGKQGLNSNLLGTLGSLWGSGA
ncbi:DUF2780 domain-containing protein [Pseudomonas sp. NY15437]|uniref:DUF2780 domain-containing protein n=1 Tax=unclassified Pseudomonas TaxID=196821 RepID=UPI00223C3C33|nr:DUF2780 domain-containing protein [Pseudomonas sp. GCEP-101]